MKDSSASRKPGLYYDQQRPELVALLPGTLGRVLDVGCGSGGVGRSIRGRATELAGIEVDEQAAAVAAETYDEVLVGDVGVRLADFRGSYDTILAYDVLEHLPDPQSVVRSLRSVAAPGALLHVSVPNARHVSLVRDLVLRGTFGYTEWGHRDSTHLRWFTRRDLVALLENAGLVRRAHGARGALRSRPARRAADPRPERRLPRLSVVGVGASLV